MLFVTGCKKNDKGKASEVITKHNYALGVYGIQSSQFKCDVFLQQISPLKSYSIAYLHNTFGNNNHCLNRILKDPRLDKVAIYAINTTCMRGNKCGKYEVVHGISIEKFEQKLLSRDPWLLGHLRHYFQKLANYLYIESLGPNLGGKKVYVSLTLEDNISHKAYKVMLDEYFSIFPGVTFVWNPVKPQPTIAGTVYEHHDSSLQETLKSPCIANLDGVSWIRPGELSTYPRRVSEGQVTPYFRKNKHCELRVIWNASLSNDYRVPFVDPRKRNFGDTNWNYFVSYIKKAEKLN